MPAVWMLKPFVCTVTAYLMMAPATTRTMPNAKRPTPERVFMKPSVTQKALPDGDSIHIPAGFTRPILLPQPRLPYLSMQHL